MSVLAVFRNSGEINNGNLSDKEDKVQNSQQIWDLTHSINLFWPLGSRRAKKANLEGAGSWAEFSVNQTVAAAVESLSLQSRETNQTKINHE